jgi:hypothetical protein
MTESSPWSDVAVAAMARLVDRSRRNTGVQLPTAFARGSASKPAPLARMIHGGRGGEVRLKLYLSTVLLAGSVHRHPTYGANAIFNVSAGSWARALALPEPETSGARRVADAQSWLHAARLLDVKRRAGAEPIVRLLSADGTGRKWARPTAPYIRIPVGLWANHWIWILGPKEIAVLIALLDLQGGRGTEDRPAPQWLSREDRARYGLSEDTWRLASHAMEELGLISTRRVSLSRDFESQRLRKTYWLHTSRLDIDAREPQSGRNSDS